MKEEDEWFNQGLEQLALVNVLRVLEGKND
jgi:hypothetical protein